MLLAAGNGEWVGTFRCVSKHLWEAHGRLRASRRFRGVIKKAHPLELRDQTSELQAQTLELQAHMLELQSHTLELQAHILELHTRHRYTLKLQSYRLEP